MNLNSDLPAKIALAIQNGIIDAQEQKNNVSEHLGNNNSRHSYLLDRITHHLVREGVPHIKAKRGNLADVFLIIDDFNKIVYYVLSENRYKELLKKPKRHTMKVLAYILKNKRAVTIESYIEVSEDYEKQLKDIYQQDLSKIPNDYTFYAITYDKFDIHLLSLKSRELDDHLNTIAERDWSEYITTFPMDVAQESTAQEVTDEKQVPLLKLKKQEEQKGG